VLIGRKDPGVWPRRLSAAGLAQPAPAVMGADGLAQTARAVAELSDYGALSAAGGAVI
jgi:hypothetical protein